ncbi:MAG: tetratricopeptide repeat protein [Thiohalocapsa sp.]
MVDSGVPALSLLELAQRVIAGRVAQARGGYKDAVTEFEQAVKIQGDLPYLEPPDWYYPVRQSLGAALLQQGAPAEAVRVFRHALAQFPNNAWAPYGLRAVRAEVALETTARDQTTEQRGFLQRS